MAEICHHTYHTSMHIFKNKWQIAGVEKVELQNNIYGWGREWMVTHLKNEISQIEFP
jgi:hypothetical protein